MKKATISILIIAFLFGCNLSYRLSKTNWTILEVKSWSKDNKDNSTWHGLLLYQGSDSIYHHFIGRIVDEWVWFNIKRNDLLLDNEKPINDKLKGHLGYYFVDPNNDFKMVKDYGN